jgi:hypothetical protein
MNREEIIRMARGAGFRDTTTPVVALGVSWEQVQRFATLVAAAERNKLAAWMIERGYATGHGDTVEDLLKELEWQIEERIRNEREACAELAVKGTDEPVQTKTLEILRKERERIAAAIRARGQA